MIAKKESAVDKYVIGPNFNFPFTLHNASFIVKS